LIASIRPTTAHAEAFRLPSLQGASATGQAGAFGAQADDPSAIQYNPAGITQLPGVQMYFGTNLVGGHTTFTSPSGATATGGYNGSIATPPPSNFYITARLKDLGITSLDGLSVGLGVNSPFGLLVRYPNDGPFSTAVTSAALPLLDIKPTLAYRLNDKISLGLGADVYTFASFLGEGHAEIKSNSPGIGGIPPGASLEVNGKDTAAGFNASLLYTPLRNPEGKPIANIGLIYRSQATLHLGGELLVNGAKAADSSFTLVLPPIYTAAIAIWPVRDQEHEWKLELDLDYVGWKSNRNLDIHLSTGNTIPVPQNWTNNYVVYLGTEYKWLQVDQLPHWEIALRGGYARSQTPVPSTTFNPAIPDADGNALAFGLGAFCRENGSFLGLFNCGGLGKGLFSPQGVGIDLAYFGVLQEPRTITDNNNPTVNGTYKNVLQAGAISFRIVY
jgi:long-chain fatty acid transport protein